MVAGELIRSEIEIKTGKCETFAEAADAMARRRIDLVDVAGGSASASAPPAPTPGRAGRTRR